MKCANCNGIGWLHPSYKPCLSCQGRGRVLSTFFEQEDTLRSVFLDAVALLAAIGIGCAAIFGLFFF